jgi:uncharacterized protein (DUF1697 family)
MPAARRGALLRGINVGRAKHIAMADLRALVEELGYGEVRTLLNSGNVVFTAPRGGTGAAAARRIEEVIAAQLGVSSRVTVLSADELDAMVTGNPLLPLLDVAVDPTRLMLAVLNDPQHGSRLAPLVEEEWAPDVLAVGERVAYMWCPQGILDSRLAEAVGRALRNGVTTRNWATMLKLHALACGKGA